MSLALRNPRLLALLVLALLVLALAVVGHVNALHMIGSLLTPLAQYGHG